MGKVFFDVGISLDGYIAGAHRGPKNPLGDGGVGLHEWMFRTSTFRDRLKIGGAGESGPDDEIVKGMFARPGANVMGRCMFDEGEANWPDEAPFGAPVFVLTHDVREPWKRPGGTTFHFVTDGIESALTQAKAAAGGRDVRISGGAETIRQYLEAGHVDEFTLHVAPVLLGEGVRLFHRINADELEFEQTASSGSELVTHISYRVLR